MPSGLAWFPKTVLTMAEKEIPDSKWKGKKFKVCAGSENEFEILNSMIK